MVPLKVIVFQINDEEYAIDVRQVQSIERVQKITRVPGLPPFVKGVMNMRGEVTPIIDLKERFGMGPSQYQKETRFLIVSVNGVIIGLIVDTANDVIDIHQDQIEPAPETISGTDREYLKGVVKIGDRLFMMVHLDRLISLEELHNIQKG
ncbi:chemotaxis protein CheW [Peribacillus glennii]|uniref:Chemotaxis protein CheW n=1 Tax=Peribacillus glennii TaxID=2303991 RepID=A0A372LD39_9BACI|nr:chemotaxis protein CheW [Peribacillus glennii]RFU63919.1 chemotaxis protein CheW [Peribacillus glennii]